MKFNQKFWKVATFVTVLILLAKPELIYFGIFIDGIGLELFLLLIEVQCIATLGYIVKSWLNPIINLFSIIVSKLDPYFFIPTKKVRQEYPLLLMHALPGVVFINIHNWFVIPDSITNPQYTHS